MTTDKLIEALPKAELHLHIEGTFEPELMFEIAERNNVKLKYNSVDELRAAYNFNNLQEFLDIYYAGANVLQKEEDFYDLTKAYLEKADADNVIHAEIMFDPQTHTSRGISFDTIISGISTAMKDAEKEFGMSTKLIMSFLRHLDEQSAFEIYDYYFTHKEKIDAIGLDSSEVGNPPSKFQRVFQRAKMDGLYVTAHAGEEGPADYVWEALGTLKVDRIDHGNRSLEDEKLVERLAKDKIPLTVCPLSNLKLKVVKDLKNHSLKKMLDYGLLATVNSDDPAYFGGYVNDNYKQTAEALDLSNDDIITLAKNSFEGSMLDEHSKKKQIKKIDDILAGI